MPLYQVLCPNCGIESEYLSTTVVGGKKIRCVRCQNCDQIVDLEKQPAPTANNLKTLERQCR
jgi:transcription elongation factor Elf1